MGYNQGYNQCENTGGYNRGGGFALIVVLFLLLIIVGATWCC